MPPCPGSPGLAPVHPGLLLSHPATSHAVSAPLQLTGQLRSHSVGTHKVLHGSCAGFSTLHCRLFLFLFLKDFIFVFEREKARAQAGGEGEAEGGATPAVQRAPAGLDPGRAHTLSPSSRLWPCEHFARASCAEGDRRVRTQMLLPSGTPAGKGLACLPATRILHLRPSSATDSAHKCPL